MGGVEAEQTRAAKVQDALYRIAELASAAQDMQEFYRAVHAVIGELMNASNLYLALYDDERKLMNYPYWADERDDDWPDANQWVEFGDRQARGVTGYVIRTGEPQHLSGEGIEELVEQGEIEPIGDLAEDWLGVPLKSEDARTVGVLAVQSYTKDVRYTEQDKELLAFVGQHVGSALSRARAIEETRQRNAELALINSVQEALAGELEMQAIYDVVGDKIQEIFDAQVVDIGIFDFAAGLTRYPYTIERGVRLPDVPVAFEDSLTARQLIETRGPILVSDVPALEAAEGAPMVIPVGEPSLSILVAPLFSGEELLGRISLQNLDRTNAFSESDVRLLTTLAGSLSVALENARLVHETRQRNAELALINSVQEAIAGELDDQAIYDAVGDKLQEVFDAQVVDIALHDEATGLIHFPYVIERGERLQEEPIEVIGFRKHVIETLEPLMINENALEETDRYGNPRHLAGEPSKSMLFVPLVTGGKATGVLSLQNVDREHAFTESDRQLLTTLAGSLSVALENARLVHETRQRNAELALINSVQDAIAGELDDQAIYDAVGDRIQEIFDAQSVSITTHDKTTGLNHHRYIIERGERLHAEPTTPAGFRKHVLETGEPVLVVENMEAEAERYGSTILAGEAPKSALFVPLVSSGTPTGVLSLQNVDREHAFTESDRQLLETLAGSLSVALENARLVHETRQRNAELAVINSVQDAIAGELDQQAIYDAVGDKIREIFDAQTVDIAIYDQAAGVLRFPYSIERGEPLPTDPIELIGFRKHVMETLQPLMINENGVAEAERYGNPYVISGEPAKSMLFVPLISGGKALGAVSLQNVDREHAFTESDQQLLATLAGGLSVALENARLVHETRQRNAELALINGVQEAIAGEQYG